MENAKVSYEIGPEYFPDKKANDVLLKKGTLTLKSAMTQPGFLRCKVKAKVHGGDYQGIATVAVSEDRIQPTVQAGLHGVCPCGGLPVFVA